MIVLYDAVDLDQIPADAHAVAGYVDGYHTWPEIAGNGRFPHAIHRLAITIHGADAHAADYEQGAMVPSMAPDWHRRQVARGVRHPIHYASRVGWMPAVVEALTRARIPRSSYHLWLADWTDSPHCPPGFDGCQWTNRGGPGRAADESLVHDDFFDYPAKTPLSHGG